MKPKFYMLIGVPASGKSTWVNQSIGSIVCNDTFVYSTDAYIEKIAENLGMTYDDVFKDGVSYKKAEHYNNSGLIAAIDRRADIIWDQTNITMKSRKFKLAKIPNVYHKTAVNFITPEIEEWKRRLSNRPGKTIPSDILINMNQNMQLATIHEGFDEVFEVSHDQTKGK